MALLPPEFYYTQVDLWASPRGKSADRQSMRDHLTSLWHSQKFGFAGRPNGCNEYHLSDSLWVFGDDSYSHLDNYFHIHPAHGLVLICSSIAIVEVAKTLVPDQDLDAFLSEHYGQSTTPPLFYSDLRFVGRQMLPLMEIAPPKLERKAGAEAVATSRERPKPKQRASKRKRASSKRKKIQRFFRTTGIFPRILNFDDAWIEAEAQPSFKSTFGKTPPIKKTFREAFEEMLLDERG